MLKGHINPCDIITTPAKPLSDPLVQILQCEPERRRGILGQWSMKTLHVIQYLDSRWVWQTLRFGVEWSVCDNERC
jgi:hypothetical protein